MKLTRWFLKKFKSPWYDRLLAEDALLAYGLYPYKEHAWIYKHDKKQIIARVGTFYKVDGSFRFIVNFKNIYGEFHQRYIPLKNNSFYTCTELIETLTPKTQKPKNPHED